MNNDGVYLMDEDAFLEFMEALKEYYDSGDEVVE